jgi:D-alanine-D-alanine ligase
LFLAEKYPALRLFGHDQSPYLISLARDRALNLPPAINRSSPPIFTVGDCRAVPYESEEFDFAMIMGNSFGYFSANDAGNDDAGHHSSEETQLDDNGDRAVLKEINRVLKVGGRMILDLVDGDYMRENYSPRYYI